MSNPVSILGAGEFDAAFRQKLQDALDTLYGLIQKAGGTAAGPTTFDELRVRMLTVLGTIDVVPEDKPPANVNSRLVRPWLTGQRGRGQIWRFEDQNDGGDLLEVRSQPYLIGTPTATSGDWEFRFYSAQRDPAGAYRSLGAIRFGSDGRIRTYDATEILTSDSVHIPTDPATTGGVGDVWTIGAGGTAGEWAAPAGGLPKRYVEGLVIRYASSSTITVSAGKARDKADGADMTLSAEVTVSTSSAGTLGYETKNLSGTVTFPGGGNVATGVGTAFLTEFCPNNTRRTLTGTISSAGGVVTGTGTRFLSEVHAGVSYGGGANVSGDLIGTTTGKGFWQVTRVDSDTSLTISLGGGAADPGFATGDGAPSVIEAPQIETAGGKSYHVSRVASDTSLRVDIVTFTAEAGVACKASARLDNPILLTPQHRSVFLVSGGSGTSLVLSTQRTAPLVAGAGTVSPSGYGTSYRRIGAVFAVYDGASSSVLVPVYYRDGSPSREAHYDAKSGVGGSDPQIVSNASATTSWTSVCASAVAPPSARALRLDAQLAGPNVDSGYLILRGRGQGDAGATVANYRAIAPAPSTSKVSFNEVVIPCDGGQWIDYGSNAATGDGTYIAVVGYEDTLE